MSNNVKFALLLICTIFSAVTIIKLFNLSEDIIHYHNRFVRRFPQHVAQEIHQTDLVYNSYYFAGIGEGKIYLGNYTAPLQMTVLDSTLKEKKIYHIELKEKNLPFQAPQIRVLGNHFFVFEGIVPYIFKGSTSNWKASLKINSGYYFSQLELMDSVNMAIRYLTPKSGESLIGALNLTDTTKVFYEAKLLQKQFDGIFDTDGSLLFNRSLNRLVYVYRYRNEFIVADPLLNLDYRGNTIDTVSKAQVRLAQVKNSSMKTFAEPPLIVNKTTAVDGNFLYVNSLLPGLYESENIWKIASIVDVYDLTDKTYRSSFPIYHINGKKMKGMLVSGNLLYALIGEKIVCYKLLEHLSQERAVRDYAHSIY